MVVALVLVVLVLLLVKERILLNFVLREILVLVKLLHRCRGNVANTQAQIQPDRAAPQGARGQGQ